MGDVDVVVVSYNSRDLLRACVEPLAGDPGIHVVVVDNASPDRSLEVLADLPVSTVALPDNRGFAAGCNAGWRAGRSPFVLFLNPDARVEASAVRRLAGLLDATPRVGIIAPRIVDGQGSLDFSQRRFPRLVTTYAQALFLHRLFPYATWTDEVIRDTGAYLKVGSPDWVSGACMLVRRSLLEQLGGLDEGFFMYCEDTDLCRGVRDAGLEVRFEPSAVCRHVGGASTPRTWLLPVLAASRIRFTSKHGKRIAAALERGGVALGSCTHMITARGGLAARRGHGRALLVALGVSRPPQ